MIEANELRRNCYVDWNGEYGKIKAIYQDEVLFYCGEEALFSDIEPIPLTEELLLKCGFEYDSDFKTYCLPNFTMQLDDYQNEGFMVILFAEDLRLIKYLHQLQNLHFALTNKELEIKL